MSYSFKKIIHRDIKLDNILLSYENENDKNNFDLMKAQVKIIDFGVSTKLNPDGVFNTACGSPIHMSPSILKNMETLMLKKIFKVLMKKLIYGL